MDPDDAGAPVELLEVDGAGGEAEEDDAPPPSVFDVASFFVEPYRSEYQPPPLSWKALRETSLASFRPPHSSQVRGGGSFTFCSFSLTFPQPSQRYS